MTTKNRIRVVFSCIAIICTLWWIATYKAVLLWQYELSSAIGATEWRRRVCQCMLRHHGEDEDVLFAVAHALVEDIRSNAELLKSIAAQSLDIHEHDVQMMYYKSIGHSALFEKAEAVSNLTEVLNHWEERQPVIFNFKKTTVERALGKLMEDEQTKEVLP